MTRATAYLVALIAVLPSAGAAQAPPSPGDRIRIRKVDGTVLTGTLDLWSTETVRLSGESADRRWEIPVSAIETLEMSLGRSHSFTKYYSLTVAASTILGGLVALPRGNLSSGRYEDEAGGLLIGYMVGIPLGVLAGSLITHERWNPVALSGPVQSGTMVRALMGSEVGLVAGQRVRVRAADGLRAEGAFVRFEGQDMLLSMTQAGQDQRVPIDHLQAVWVGERATRRGARIGVITGVVLGIGSGIFLSEYVLQELDCGGEPCKVPPTVVAAGVLGALGGVAGAAVGALIGVLVREWSPVWP